MPFATPVLCIYYLTARLHAFEFRKGLTDRCMLSQWNCFLRSSAWRLNSQISRGRSWLTACGLSPCWYGPARAVTGVLVVTQ